MTLDTYTAKLKAIEAWITENGGINHNPTRTIGQLQRVSELAGVPLTLDEIEAGQELIAADFDARF